MSDTIRIKNAGVQLFASAIARQRVCVMYIY